MVDVIVLVVRLLLIVGGLAALVGVGVWLAYDPLRQDQAKLAKQRAALDEEWRALANARRIGDIFYSAQSAMRDQRATRRPQPPRRMTQ